MFQSSPSVLAKIQQGEEHRRWDGFKTWSTATAADILWFCPNIVDIKPNFSNITYPFFQGCKWFTLKKKIQPTWTAWYVICVVPYLWTNRNIALILRTSVCSPPKSAYVPKHRWWRSQQNQRDKQRGVSINQNHGKTIGKWRFTLW